MEIKNILELGEKIEVKPHKESTTIVIYHQGKAHAKRLMTLLRTKGVAMPSKTIKKMAGIEEITAPGQIHAGCYAKLVYDRVTEARNKPSAIKSAEEIVEELDAELANKPIAYFLADSPVSFSDPKVHTIIGAKKFVGFPKKDKERIWESLGVSENEDAEEK